MAAGLLALGITKGDRVGIWAPNCQEVFFWFFLCRLENLLSYYYELKWILTQYATALIGAIQVNINPAYKSNELSYSLNKVGCKALIMSETYKSQNFVETLLTVCPEISSENRGQLNLKNLPHLKNLILISEKEYK